MALRPPPMQVTVEKLSPVLVEFDVEIAKERVKSELDKAYADLGRTARVRGFRPGKAPRKILARMFGPRVSADVAQKLLDETFDEAVASKNIRPINKPEFAPNPIKSGGTFNYKARFEVVPEVESVDFSGLVAKRPKVEVTDEDIDQEIQHLREHHATVEPVAEERAAESGDIGIVSFKVLAGGEAVEDAGAEDFQVEIGSGKILPEIEQALIGVKPGGKAEASVEMPATHPHPQLKGKKTTFDITLVELKHRVFPEIDDEFAKDVDEAFESLDDLKKSLTEQLEKEYNEKSENSVAEQLVVELCRKNPIPVPPSLVQRQAQITEQEIVRQARQRGQQGSVNDDLRGRIAADSEIKVRAGLLMAEIAKQEGIKIGDPEIEEGLKELAEQTGKNVAKLRAEYREPQQREMLIGMILENKVLDLLEEKAEITDATAEELAADAETASSEAAEGEKPEAEESGESSAD